MRWNVMKRCSILLVFSSALAQDSEEVTRRLWSNEFAAARPGTPSGPIAKTAPAYSYLGVTLWRDRPTTNGDPEHARALVLGKRVTAERVDASAVLREGDSLQFAVESATAGHLYVIDREVYRDGSKGEPMLIFPNRDVQGGTNRVEPGIQVLLPDGERFLVKRTRVDLVGEELTFLITPKPIPGVIATGEATLLSPALVAKWEKQWKTTQTTLESTEKGALLTPSEVKARQGARLTAQDPLPHTMFRVDSKAGNPILVSLELKFNRVPAP